MPGILTDEFQIDACLARHAASVREVGPQAWEFTLAGGTSRKGTARLDFDWLTIDLPLGRPRTKAVATGRRLVEVLSLVPSIEGLAKFGFDPGTKRIHVQAEIPLVLEDDPMERIDLAFAGFEQAMQKLDALRSGSSDSEAGESSEGEGAATAANQEGVDADASANANDDELKARCQRWKQLCEESGWPLHERASSKLAISLDVPGSFCQAVIEAAGPGSIRIRHEAGRHALDETSQRALAVFLLVGSRTARMARAYFERGSGLGVRDSEKALIQTNGGTVDQSVTAGEAASAVSRTPNPEPPPPEATYGWEIVLQDPPALFELDRALSALSMACRLSTNELSVLTDEEVAKRYLAVQGMVS